MVYGYFPCYSEGNDLVVLHDDGPQKGAGAAAVHLPAAAPRPAPVPGRLLPAARTLRAGRPADVIAFHLVTMGAKVAEATAELFAANAYRDYLELHGLSVQLTEALAELWHARVREELGFGADDDESLDAILRQGYRGSRYSFGYPACPDLEDRAVLVELLDPSRIGVTLSEELQLHPEQSTDAHGGPPPRGQVLQRDMSEVAIRRRRHPRRRPPGRGPVGHGRHAGRHRAVLDRRGARAGRAPRRGLDRRARLPARRQRPDGLGAVHPRPRTGAAHAGRGRARAARGRRPPGERARAVAAGRLGAARGARRGRRARAPW